MAVVWSVATLLCGLARSYEQMLAARVLVGVGEAAYGSVGIAVIISVFPKHMRATLDRRLHGRRPRRPGAGRRRSAAWSPRPTAGGSAFLAIGIGGLLLALVYPLVRPGIAPE